MTCKTRFFQTGCFLILQHTLIGARFFTISSAADVNWFRQLIDFLTAPGKKGLGYAHSFLVGGTMDL